MNLSWKCDLLITFFILLITEVPVSFSDCKFINNAIARVHEQYRFVGLKTYNKTITGCLRGDQFLNEVVRSIDILCTNTEITQLKEDSVGHLEHLNYFMIAHCPIDLMEPKTFTKIPYLYRVVLQDCTLKKIPKDVFIEVPSLGNLDLQRNEIDFMEDQVFGNLTNLEFIYLSHNKLTYWNRNWFFNNDKVNHVEFTHNLLKRIPSRAFIYLPKLTNIDLSYNKISVIDANAFVGLSSLTTLNLNHNLLTAIPLDMFSKVIGTRMKLSLEANLLNYLPISILEKMVFSIGSLYLTGNPFACPCLNRINEWFYHFNVQRPQGNQIYPASNNFCLRPDIPRCAFSRNDSTLCTETIDEELTKRFISYNKQLLPRVFEGCFNRD